MWSGCGASVSNGGQLVGSFVSTQVMWCTVILYENVNKLSVL